MIVVDASALLEVLLRTPAAPTPERRLFDPRQTLHTPHVLNGEVASMLRRYAANGDIDGKRGSAALADLAVFPLHRYPMMCCCRVYGNCGTILPPMTPYTLLSPKRSERRSSRATGVSQMPRDIAQRSSWSEDPA